MRQARCHDIERALQDLVDGALPSDETARLCAHTERCSRCHALVARRSALQRVLLPPPELELPLGFRAALLERLYEAAASTSDATPEPIRYAAPQEPWRDRVATWWTGTRLSPMFQPAAALAGIAMAVVLASSAAQVVGTWRSREIGLPAGASSMLTPGATQAPSGSGAVPSGTPDTPSPPVVPPSPAPLQLAAVSPEAESVVLRDGFDVVAAADGALIDPARSTVRLRLDGRAVASAGIRVTRDFVSYTPAGTLPEGSHTVHVEVLGADGQSSSVEWDFYVVGS